MDKENKKFLYDHSFSILSGLDFSLFEAVLEHFPYSLNITSIDGTMVYANKKFLEGALDHIKETTIGNYNILTEENINVWGLSQHVKKAFSGQIVTTKKLKFPNKELVDIRYSKESAFINLYHDITSFPIYDAKKKLTHIVTIFIASEINMKRAEIVSAKTYIDNHWIESLSVPVIAKHVNLSESRLRTLFKEETGFTLHDYYHDVKMHHICDLLTHENLSISEVFSQCGLEYNSYYVNLFKKHTFTSPGKYRKQKKNFK